MPARSLWTPNEAQSWYARQPWLVGCNFIPSTAINQLEMWQHDTFDVDTIDRELGWASGLGFNTARVFLHDLLWQQHAHSFLDRVERFLDVATRHGIRPLFVLFDGVWDPRPQLGTQHEPRPRVHNSGWVQSPGAALLSDPSRHDALQSYVTGVIERFRNDERVFGWDLFNEPDNPNLGYRRHELENKAHLALALLAKTYGWARDAGPSQPLTSGVWHGRWRGDDVSPISELMLSQSDVISFHSYDPPELLLARIDELEPYGRPLLLTEYMSRGSGSTFEAVLPLLKQRRIAAYNWGLVAGKTQTHYPWDSWAKIYTAEPDPWFHDILREDGSPYRLKEIDFIRAIIGLVPMPADL